MPREDRVTAWPVTGCFKRLDPGLFLVGLLVLLAVSPLFPSGLPSIADAPIHLFRTMEMVSCWRDGVYYPRWAPNFAFGYGYPLFNFAPPLPYFIAGVLHIAGFSLEMSIKLLAMLCLVAYGLGMYLFARNVLGPRGALVASAAYIYTPFRFREILLYGGNYPQILAIGLFPWVLWAFERILADGRRRYVAAGALCYGALILSHNFHALVFTPLLVLYIFVLTLVNAVRSHLPGSKEFFRALGRPWPVVALVLGLAITAFFWAPALYDLQYTAAQADYYLARSDFRLRLLSLKDLLALPLPLDKRADNPYVPFSLGSAVLVLALLGVVYLLFLLLRSRLAAKWSVVRPWGEAWETLHLTFFLLVLLVMCLMMLRSAALLWERLPFLPYAEFPWRLLGIANLSTAFLAGGSLRLWERIGNARHRRFPVIEAALAMSLLALISAVAVYFYPQRDFLHWGTPTLKDYTQYEIDTQNLGTTGLAEYLPRWVKEIPKSSPMVDLIRDGKPAGKLDLSGLPPGFQVTPLAHSAISDRFSFIAPTSFRAQFYTFYFPGWRAYLDGKLIPLDITSPLGLIAVDIPAGEHELLLHFGETPFRLAMDTLSVVALVGLAIWSSSGWLRERKRRRPFSAPVASAHRLAGTTEWKLNFLVPGVLLSSLLVAKVGFIDPHSSWFRSHSPPGQVINVQHPMHVRLEDNVLFLGYDLVSGESPRAGQLLQVRLYWQAEGPLTGDYISFIHLDAPPDNTTFATGDNYHPGDPQAQNDVPSLQWDPALYVRDEHRLMLPEDMLPIAYSLRAGLYERVSGRRLSILPGQADGQSGDAIMLQQIHVLPGQSPQLASVHNRERYRLGDSIELVSYDIEAVGLEKNQAPSGRMVVVTLYWRTLASLEEDHTVFLHLVDGAGQLQAQQDGPPLNGRYPTYNWLPYQVIQDKIALGLGPELLPGEYQILIGMYNLATGQRLAVSSANGSVPDNAIPLKPILRLGY